MYTLEEFMQYNILQVSRAFDYSDVLFGSSALVPFGDMINHSSDDNTKYDVTSDGFVFSAIKDIKRGEQILIDYGYNKFQ